MRLNRNNDANWGTKAGYDPAFLAFDTSGPYISVALYCDRVVAENHVEMARGQAENLIPLAENVLTRSGGTWADLDYIAVGVGPGNFTGIRISVSAARGLSLGLGIPVIGVSTFETLLDWDGPISRPALIVSVEAPRGAAYVQHFRYGKPQSAPRMIDPSAPPPDLELPMNMQVVGYKAEEIARSFHAEWEEEVPERNMAARIGRMAEAKVFHNLWDGQQPKPLYVKAPDAAPSREKPPVLLP